MRDHLRFPIYRGMEGPEAAIHKTKDNVDANIGLFSAHGNVSWRQLYVSVWGLLLMTTFIESESQCTSCCGQTRKWEKSEGFFVNYFRGTLRNSSSTLSIAVKNTSCAKVFGVSLDVRCRKCFEKSTHPTVS